MSLNMLRHNIEMLEEVSDSYYKNLDLASKGDKNAAKLVVTLKNQILFLEAGIKKLVEQEKNG